MAALALAALLAWLNWMLRRAGDAPPPPAINAGQPNAAVGKEVSRVERWGRLATEQVILERPDRMFGNPDAYFDSPAPWNFGETPAEAIDQLFAAAPLQPADRAWLLDRSNWRSQAGAFLIAPPPGLVLGLSPAARGEIYGFLAHFPDNPFKGDPFKIATHLAPGWFADSGVSAETERLIRSLTYQRGPMLCFADPGLLGDRVPVAERLPVLKALSRMPALRAFLELKPGDELGPVTNYWQPGGRIASLLPLLESLRQSREGGRIDLGFLLPRFCVERLFTFPDRDTNRDADTVDCFWTALNFFRHPPEQRFLDVPTRLQYLQDRYGVVTGEPVLGDLLVLYDARQAPIHACVYVAGNVVFTKNGATAYSPWVLMSYRDMLAYYSMEGTPTMRVLRVRGQPES